MQFPEDFLNGVSMLPVIIEHFNLTPLIFGPMRGDLDSDWSKNERSHFEVQILRIDGRSQNLENLVKSGPAN